MYDRKELPRIIRMARERHHLSQTDLARRVHVTPQAVQLYEKEYPANSVPRPKKMQELIKVLGLKEKEPKATAPESAPVPARHDAIVSELRQIMKAPTAFDRHIHVHGIEFDIDYATAAAAVGIVLVDHRIVDEARKALWHLSVLRQLDMGVAINRKYALLLIRGPRENEQLLNAIKAEAELFGLEVFGAQTAQDAADHISRLEKTNHY